MSICFYGELDPYTGSIRNAMEELPHLLRSLKLLCILHDFVVLPPGNLVEHPLALPLFESLAPFVRAGRLGTSGPGQSGGPLPYVLQRAERTRGGVLAAARRRPRRQRVAEIAEVRDRWAALLPRDWTVVRDVPLIVDSYVKRASSSLAQMVEATHSTAAARLLVAIERALDLGRVVPDRNYLLAQATLLKHEVPPTELASVLAVIQGIYFEQGTSSRSKWRADRARGATPAQGTEILLYPGAFARRYQGLVAMLPGEKDLPIDWNLQPGVVAQRLARLGLSDERLLALPERDLFELARQPEWQVLAERVRQGDGDEDSEREIRAMVIRHRDFRDALPKVAPLAGAASAAQRLAPTVLPDTWQLAVQSALGSRLAWVGEGAASPMIAKVELDWLAGTLRRRGDPTSVALTAEQAQFITLLAVAGDVGLATDEVEQTLCELDVLARQRVPEWPERAQRGSRLPSLRNRIDVLRFRIDEVLRPCGIAVRVSSGRWHMEGEGRPALVLLRTAWDPDAASMTLPRPDYLRGQEACLWAALCRVAPAPLGLSALAQTIGREDDRAGREYAAKVISRLRRKLAARGEGFGILGWHRGSYRVVVLTPTAPPRTRIPADSVTRRH